MKVGNWKKLDDGSEERRAGKELAAVARPDGSWLAQGPPREGQRRKTNGLAFVRDKNGAFVWEPYDWRVQHSGTAADQELAKRLADVNLAGLWEDA